MDDRDEEGLRSWNEDTLDTECIFSSTECTGLISRAPVNESEAEAYNEMLNAPQFKKKRGVHAEKPSEKKL